jgi:hypothetical protein
MKGVLGGSTGGGDAAVDPDEGGCFPQEKSVTAIRIASVARII